MSLALQRIKVYFKLAVMAIVVIACTLVIYENRNNTVTVWCYREFKDINVLWLILCTSVGSVTAWIVLRATRNVFRDISELNRRKAQVESEKRQKEMAAKLAEHDAKLSQNDEKLPS
jgi:glycopeptide antibiotics resistance protein